MLSYITTFSKLLGNKSLITKNNISFAKMVSTSIELSKGIKMPIIGFGTWQTNDEELEKAVHMALEAGYRHIDTAYVYENEKAIGRVLDSWLKSGKVKREDLFIVTKLPPGGNRQQTVEKYMKRSLENLRLDYVDQFLVHTPFAFIEDENDGHPKDENGFIKIETTTDHLAIWKEMEKQQQLGRTKTIGVSNFNIKQIQRLLNHAEIKPVTNQVELHLYFQQKEMVDFCHKNSMSVTAYSPLGSRGLKEFMAKIGYSTEIPDLMDNPVVKEIAATHGKTPAQILLKHTIQKGITAIPKSTNAARLKQNIDIFNFKLSEEEMKKLNGEDKGSIARICDFGFLTGIEKHPEFPF